MTNFYPRQNRNPATEPDRNPGGYDAPKPNGQVAPVSDGKRVLSGTATREFIEMVRQRFPRSEEHQTTLLEQRAVLMNALGELRQLHYLAEKANLNLLSILIGRAYAIAFEAAGPETASLVLEGRKSNRYQN